MADTIGIKKPAVDWLCQNAYTTGSGERKRDGAQKGKKEGSGEVLKRPFAPRLSATSLKTPILCRKCLHAEVASGIGQARHTHQRAELVDLPPEPSVPVALGDG